MDKWNIIHRYNNLVTMGKAEELTCALCSARLQPRLGPGDNPMLRCIAGHNAFPGDSWYQQIEQMIRSISI